MTHSRRCVRQRKRHEGVVQQSPPPTKRRRCDAQRMAAELRNFHITTPGHGNDGDDAQRHWFFMQKPVETFQNIEDRLSISDESEEEANTDDEQNEDRLDLGPELSKMIKGDKRKVFSPWIRQPSSETALVLWRPREELIRNSLLPQIVELSEGEPGYEDSGKDGDESPLVSFPTDEKSPLKRAMGDTAANNSSVVFEEIVPADATQLLPPLPGEDECMDLDFS